MKLATPLSDHARQRVNAAMDRLENTHADFEGKLERFAQGTRTHFSLENNLRLSRAGSGLLPEAAAREEALRAEIARAKEIRAVRQGEMEAARESTVDAIGRAGNVVREVAGCLVEQYRRGLTAALQPFCTDAAGAVQTLPEHRTEMPALHAFLSRGLHVSRTASAADLEYLKFELCQTLAAIRDGAHVWRLPGEPAPRAAA